MSGKKEKNKDIFYKDGLRFECIGCGNCCTGAPGFVYLSDNEVKKIASYLKIGIYEFIKKFTRLVTIYDEIRLSLKEKSNYDCIFFKDKRCLIYPVRPYQCSSYPFWKNNIKSEKNWNQVARECPGVNHGKKFSAEEITAIVKQRPEYDIKKFSFKVVGNGKSYQ